MDPGQYPLMVMYTAYDRPMSVNLPSEVYNNYEWDDVPELLLGRGYTQSLNRYSYCLSNPLKYSDESGEIFLRQRTC